MSLTTIDMLIGLVVVYFMLSLVLAAVREAIEARLKSRSRHLALGIMMLLNHRNTVQAFYNNPLVSALWRPTREMAYPGKPPEEKPTEGAQTEKKEELKKVAVALKRVAQNIATFLQKMKANRKEPASSYGALTDTVPLPDPTFKGFSPAAAVPLALASLFLPRDAKFQHAQELPSYIPSRTFALTIVALLQKKAAVADDGKLNSATQSVDAFKIALSEVESPVVSASVKTLLAQAQKDEWSEPVVTILSTVGDDLDKAITAIENWYDSSMDRVSGWYKRETHIILFWLGLVLAISLNVDTIFLAKHLNASPEARSYLVKFAEKRLEQGEQQTKASRGGGKTEQPVTQKSSDEPQNIDAEGVAKSELQAIAMKDEEVRKAVRSLSELSLPIGWTAETTERFWLKPHEWNKTYPELAQLLPHSTLPSYELISAIFGWLITAFALTLGAPFWFDVLNKIMVIRSTVKPTEKSPEEGSEDRAKKKARGP